MASNPAIWITRRTFWSERVGTGAISVVLFLMTVANILGYRLAYPTFAERTRVAAEFGGNTVARLLYGVPFNMTTVGGYTTWRVLGFGSIIVAIWGLFIAINALRGEEESGRWELALAGRVTRPGALCAALAGMLVSVSVVWLATAMGAVAVGPTHGDMAFGECLYMALAIICTGLVFIGVGALLSQIVPTARSARIAGMAIVGLSLLVRFVADVQQSFGWLRWLTPFGWAEELHAFSGPRPVVLLLPAAAVTVTVTLAGVIARHRDLGGAVIPERVHYHSSDRLLGSTTALALRREVVVLLGWLTGTAFFAIVMGLLADTAVRLVKQSPAVERLSSKLGLATARGYLSYIFLFFVLTVCLVAVSNVTAARGDESTGTLETLFALPVSRHRWLCGRITLTLGAAAAVAITAGIGTWIGAISQAGDVNLRDMLAAAVNCLPIAVLFLGLTVLIFGIRPRATSGFAYGAVGIAFLWQLLIPVFSPPAWVPALSPFNHVAAIPAQAVDLESAAVMMVVGLVALVAGIVGFGQRDLQGA